MAQTPQKQPIPRWLQNAIERYDNGKYCHTDMPGTESCKDKIPIDCSHLGKQIDDDAGFDIGYMDTAKKHSPEAAKKYRVTEAQRDGEYVRGLDVRPAIQSSSKSTRGRWSATTQVTAAVHSSDPRLTRDLQSRSSVRGQILKIFKSRTDSCVRTTPAFQKES